MSDATERYAPEQEREPTLVEMIELAMRRISAAIVIAGAAIALAIYARPSPPHYEVIATPNGILRTDTSSGTVIACEGGRCWVVVRHGKRLVSAPKASPAPTSAPAQKALPKPASAPAPESRQK